MRNDENLLKLAAYLESLPADYEHFSMAKFHSASCEPTAELDGCGTVACAVGHGPAAGIAHEPGEGWVDYSKRVFTSNADEWDWCFGEWWSEIDNSPHGAARRIRHLVEHDLPDGADEQRHADAPYIFATQVPS